MDAIKPKLTGGCLCGAVRYESTEAPVISGYCHCLSCQKLSGSGHTLNVLLPEAGFTARGTTKAYTWQADSGNMVTTRFCPECGSPLFGHNPAFTGMVVIRAASLDDSSDIAPAMSVYAKRLQPWDHLADSIPSFPAMPPRPPV